MLPPSAENLVFHYIKNVVTKDNHPELPGQYRYQFSHAAKVQK